LPREETQPATADRQGGHAVEVPGAHHGMVALLFTDVVGSMLRRPGDAAGEHVLRACLDLLREPMRSFGGREVKALGDGLLAAFPTTAAALSSAVAMVRALERQNGLPGSVPLTIRIGVHGGEPVEDEEGDLLGIAVAVAHRLCDAAAGGQILISETVRGILGPGAEYPLRPAGRLDVKGVGERVGAYEVVSRPAGPADRVPATEPALPPHAPGRRGVLRSRLMPPRVPRGALPRPDLVHQVRAGFQDRLVTIVAGAGYGKSTLLAQALEGLERPSVWLSCDEQIRSAEAFAGHVVEGIGQLYPGVGQRLSLGGSPEDLVTRLCNEIVETVVDEFLIVIDDAHAVEGSPAGETLGLLVRDLPPNVHVAIASRTALPVSAGRARAGGVVTVGEDALALTPQESVSLLSRSRPGLDAAAAAELHRRTEGWVAGLILAARVGPETPSSLAGQDVFQFLAQEVLARQPEDVQRFLMDTAVFERFTPALAEAITGRPGAALVIQWLVESHLFCVPLEDEGPEQWYRYHHLFQACLRRHLRTVDAPRAAELNRRAGMALLSAGEPLEAIPYLIAAGELAVVVEALEPLAESLVRSPQAEALWGWLLAIPAAALKERPSLILAQASLLFVRARPDEAFEALDAAIETLLRAGDHERAALVLARLIQARVPGGLGLSRGIEISARYVPRIDPTARMLPVARILLAGGYGWACRFEEAERELDEALALPAVERFPLARTYAAVIRAHLIDRIRGHVSGVPDALDAAIRDLEVDDSDEELGFLVYASGYRAFALSYVGRHEEALAEVERQARAAARTGQTAVAENTAGWIRMVAFAELGRWNELEQELEVVDRAVRFRDWPTGYYFLAQRARLLAHRGDRGGVLAEIAAARRAMTAHLGGMDFNALCDLALAASSACLADEALPLAREAHAVATASSAAWGRARAALIVAHCDGSPEGDRALGEALQITSEWGYDELWYRKERPCAPSLLSRAIERGLGPKGVAERLVALCGGEVLEALLRDSRPEVRAGGLRAHGSLATGPRLTLRIEGLGGFLVRRGDVAVPQSAFGRDRARSLLAALACARGPVPRDRLLEWFWPDLSPERGSRALRTTLHSLRRALEPERPRFDSGSVVRLDAETCQLMLEEGDGFDADEFLRIARASGPESTEARLQRLQRGDALVRGALMPEWPYAEWAESLRTEVGLEHRRVLAELAEALLSAGAARDAADRFERLLLLEPEREEWHRGRMLALAASGELALALRQYHVCRSLLQRELGVAPSEPTRALFQELLARSG
jgi:DNA-binding SARP family transcriptional activator/class 3 adenylate cyclase